MGIEWDINLQADNGVKKAVSFLDAYDLTKDDCDSIMELCKISGKSDVMSQIPPKVSYQYCAYNLLH